MPLQLSAIKDNPHFLRNPEIRETLTSELSPVMGAAESQKAFQELVNTIQSALSGAFSDVFALITWIVAPSLGLILWLTFLEKRKALSDLLQELKQKI